MSAKPTDGWVSRATEAQNIYVETGLTPRQIAEQRAELAAALDRLCTHSRRTGSQIADDWDFAREALAKVRG